MEDESSETEGEQQLRLNTGSLNLESLRLPVLGGVSPRLSGLSGLTVECKSVSPRIQSLSLELGSSPRRRFSMEDSWKGEILPEFLYIGDRLTAGDADRLKAIGITHVVNATLDIPNFFDEAHAQSDGYLLQYFRCPIQDSPESAADISSQMQGVVEFIRKSREAGGKCLVHCRAGMSRSATLVLAFLVLDGWALKKALLHVNDTRFVQPNSGFSSALIALEYNTLGPIAARWLTLDTEPSTQRL